jgi:phytanoyl-CoA hydroxylase
MRKELTEFEIESYQLNGFVAIQDFLDDDELNHWRSVVQAVAGEPSPEGLSNIRARSLSNTHPEIAALWRNETVGGLIGQLGRFDGVRHLGDGISYVLQGHGATPWHCNMHESPVIDSAEAISLYVPLDEFRWYNKALNFLPGSHKLMPLGVRTMSPSLRNATFGSLLEEYPQLKNIEPICTEGRAGMAVFYNLLGVHGSAPNMTPRARRMTSATFCKDGEVANGQLGVGVAQGKSAEGIIPLKAGESLTDAQAPLIWKRT